MGVSNLNQLFEDSYGHAIVRDVKHIIVHGDYNPYTLNADIALLKMETPVSSWTEFVQPACVKWSTETVLPKRVFTLFFNLSLSNLHP